MKKLFLFISLLTSAAMKAQEINIIPKPAEMKIGKDSFIFDNNTFILAYQNPEIETAGILNQFLKSYYGFTLPIKKQARDDEKYIIFSSIHAESTYPKEGYKLTVSKSKIEIAAKPGVGWLYGTQTLIQLFPPQIQILPLSLPQLTITDYPRFAYRGMHLDVARHFFPVSFIKKYIDYLALHKFNYFHWHLTEDQGWRIEIKKYPKLTEVGAWRSGTIIGRYPGKGNDGIRYGGYYTQEEIKEIVKYAADRYITVVPEIEMPGHASAAIASYPFLSCFPDEPTIKYFPKQCTWHGDSTGKQVQQTWGVFDDVFCAGKENTFKFLEDVMDEVLSLFPSKYIHVGGDECPKANWKKCPNCQKRLKDENLKDEHELQSYFIQRMEKYLNSKGRKLIGWDEILEGGLAPNAIVMSWRGEEGGIEAAKQNHEVIMTPGGWCYFDHTQSENEDSVTIGGFTPLEKVYSYEPVPKELSADKAKYVLGAQGNVWTEYMKNNSKVEYMIFPRMSALSEVLWAGKLKRNWEDFEKRLMVQFNKYELWKANYSKAYFDLDATVMPTEDFTGVYWKIESKFKNDSILFYDDANQKMDCLIKQSGMMPDSSIINGFYPLPFTKRILCSDSYGYTLTKRGFETPLMMQEFKVNKATGKKIVLSGEASGKYPGDGAFTLVNGVQNQRGLEKSKEFLGFSGTHCEAMIDLGKKESISNIVIHTLHLQGSWIWRPQYVEVLTSTDGQNFNSIKMTDDFIITAGNNGIMKIEFNALSTRFVKVLVKNWGEIPDDNPGAGNKAWLFIDEIEINSP